MKHRPTPAGYSRARRVNEGKERRRDPQHDLRVILMKCTSHARVHFEGNNNAPSNSTLRECARAASLARLGRLRAALPEKRMRRVLRLLLLTLRSPFFLLLSMGGSGSAPPERNHESLDGILDTARKSHRRSRQQQIHLGLFVLMRFISLCCSCSFSSFFFL